MRKSGASSGITGARSRASSSTSRRTGWRSTEWPKGHYSIAQFQLQKVAGGTRLTFEQYGIPSGDFQDIAEGWKTFYWAPLKQYLEG